jgi:hypothetical protein
MALKYECVVTVGYPEKVERPASPGYYNSAIIVNADGKTIANSDETWALEGFFDGVIPGLGHVAMGICKWQTTDFNSETSLTTPPALCCKLTFDLQAWISSKGNCNL